MGGLLPLLVIAVLILASANLASPSSSTQASDPPQGIHLTWRQNDTAHTIVVTWKTSNDNAGDEVLYDTTSRGVPSLYQYGENGNPSETPHTYEDLNGYIHDVELTGLEPDTIYYFICGGENGGYSEERSFRTAPEASTNIRFVAGGDSRYDSETNWPEERDDISREMAKFNPSFVLFTGDFVRQGDYQLEWDNWLAAAQEYWVDNDNLTIPIIPCIGNHELYGDGGASYYAQFYLPSDEKWYSLDWGPDLHIIVLNSETGISGEQSEWLEDDLATHASCKWKIAIYHRPAFTKSKHSPSGSIQTNWVPLFDTYHVDLVISGHNHCYERTDPINYTRSGETCVPSPAEGTIYVTSGGWGAPPYSENYRQVGWTGYYPVAKYNFVVVDIENDTLHLQAVGTDGETFDEYFIHKVPEGEGLPAAAIIIPIAVIACVVPIYLLKMRGTRKKS